MNAPRFTDYWQRTGHRYVPAAATDIRETFARIRRDQQRAEVVAGWPMPALPEWTPVARSWTDCVRVD